MGVRKAEASGLEDEIVTAIFQFIALLRTKKSVPLISDLTLAQLHCVIAIGDSTPTMAQVAKNLEVSMPTVSVTVDNLVKVGYVKRIQDQDDRRIVRVGLTETGKKIKRKAREEKAAIIRNAISKLSITQRKKTQEVMATLLQILEEQK